jgi:itaconate CoA-transferase
MIKIERPQVGDFARNYDRRVRGLASHLVWCNRSKGSLTLDFKSSRTVAWQELQAIIVEVFSC